MKKILTLCLFLIFLSAGNARAVDVTLTWNAPTANVDNSPLMDLGGYKVYYGNQSGSYSQTIDVSNVTTYIITNLADGIYYFAVTAYDTSGNESGYSNECSKTIDTTGPMPPGGLQCNF